MVARGSLGKFTPKTPTSTQYAVLVAVLSIFSLGGGYFAGIQPAGEWRYFSWHPLLMTCGMVGFAGIGAITKKLGGYKNTKLHALFGGASMISNVAGLYVIYRNKETMGFQHLKTNHARVGFALFLLCFGLGMAGTVFLHPDWGMDKTNTTIRFWHKTASRLALIFSWITAIMGLLQLVPNDPMTLAMYGLPLACLVPFTLM
jgi:hypothetical protein